MNRRTLLALFGGAAFASPSAAWAQQTGGVRRLGVLMSTVNEPEQQRRLAALRDELSKLGWTEGRNLQVEVRWGAGSAERMREYAVEFGALAPDVVLAFGSGVLEALREPARRVPIVFVGVFDPIGRGFVESLSRPGGNITGFTSYEFGLDGKWLELLKEIAPQTRRVAPIGNPESTPYGEHLRAVETAARLLGVEVVATPVHDAHDLEAAIIAVAREPGGGMINLQDSFNYRHRPLILELAARHRVPAMHPFPFIAVEGGLIAYGVDQAGQFRQAAAYVDRILNGEKPADLPVQQPTKFELVINLKTAKALGLTVPQTLLARADEVIE